MTQFRERTLGDVNETERIVESGAKLPRPETVLGQNAPPSPAQDLAQNIAKEMQNACITTMQAPYVIPPMDARPRMALQTITLAPGATANMALLAIPSSCQGAVFAFGQGLVPTLGGVPPVPMWTDVVWTLTRNGSAISPDYAGFAGQIGTVPVPTRFYIMLREGDIMGIIITNNSVANSYNATVMYTGWDWPSVNRFDRDKCFTKKPRD